MASVLTKFLGGSVLALAVGAYAPVAHAEGPAPIVLTDGQMDRVTAGLGIGLDLAATATGLAATTSTAGAVQIGAADVLQVDVNSNGAVRLVRDSPATVAFGGGQASAHGNDPNCTAQIALVGDIAYLNQSASVITAPMSAICQCAALAISLTPR